MALLGVACAVAFVALDYPVAGSLALAGSISAVGLVFVGITTVAAQVTSTGRGTLGASSIVLLVAFVLRAVGDISGNALRWLSPIGWAQSVRAFAGEQWWTLALCVVVAVVLFVVAGWLFNRRDLGSGLLAVRPGRAHAGRTLSTPLGLAVRLQRGVLVGWVVGLFVTGIVDGSIADEIEEMIEDNPVYADIFTQLGGGSITDAFLSTALVMLALIASGYPISAALRMRTEENAGRADSVLAAPVSRWRWMASHLVVTVGGAILIVAAGGLGTGVGVAVVLDDPDQVLRLTGASLVTVPPVLVLTGITVALYGLVPKAALGAWAALAVVAVVGFLGEVLRLPAWTRDLSPFEHVPAVPAVDVRWLPLVVLVAVAAALVAAGAWGFRRRDVAAT
jgi:ABC-2 type transport system permease protein